MDQYSSQTHSMRVKHIILPLSCDAVLNFKESNCSGLEGVFVLTKPLKSGGDVFTIKRQVNQQYEQHCPFQCNNSFCMGF